VVKLPLFVALGAGMTLLTCYSVAQANNACYVTLQCANYNILDAQCIPEFPPGTFNINAAGPYAATGEVATATCAAATNSCTKCGSPIDLATGNTYVEETDVNLPGLGGGLTLTRTWNSQNVGDHGMFGNGWRTNFEESLYLDGSDHLVKLLLGNGTIWSYAFANDWGSEGTTPIFASAAPQNVGEQMAFGGTYNIVTGTMIGGWSRTSKNGYSKAYGQWVQGDPIFHLFAITDRNGNATNLSYAPPLLTTVTDPASRHLFFTYGTVNVGGIGITVVTSLSTDFGISLTYQYDSLANLVKVIKPDNSFVTYEYNSTGLLTAVKDSNGKLLESHTYDAYHRGTTSVRAGGVDAVTVSY